MGLYLKISIVPFCLLILIIYKIKDKNKHTEFKLISFKRYFRYLKIIFNKKVIIIIMFFGIISNSIVLYQNYKYDNLYKNLENKEIKITGIVTNQEKNKYKIKVENGKYKNTYLYIISDDNLEYGDKIEVTGKFVLPKKRRNYKGFDYSLYLKTLKIYGTIYGEKHTIISKNNGNFILSFTNKIYEKIKSKIDNSFLKEDEKGVLKGIILGDKTDLSEDIEEDFSESNISHILAVSGMHISYIILISSFILNNLIGKHFSKIGVSFIIFIYMCITCFSPSVVRAGITGIIGLISGIVYRKNDIAESLSISLIILLIYNPYLITNVGLQLSYLGTIGIILFQNNLNKFIDEYLYKLNRKAIRRNMRKLKLMLKILNFKIFKIIRKSIIITISVMILIIPIILLNFNKIGIFSLIISIIVSCFLIGPIMILGIIFIFFNFKFIENLLGNFIKLLLHISKFGSNMPFNNIYLVTPSIIQVVFYYLIVFIFNFFLKIKLKKNLSSFELRMKNLLSLFKYKLKRNKNKILSCFLIISLVYVFILIIPKNLKIYFIDVDQGDSCLIVTPNNKKILIDGGGSETFNVGKNTLMPYLLDRKITKIDYIFISHFDTDHVGGILYLLQKMKVKNVVIGKQFEQNENYKEFIKIIKTKNIKTIVVEKGYKLQIENNLYFDILWPDLENIVDENIINNNSLVCKLNYKKFSLLFTGDIERKAEEILVSKYKKTSILKSTILKVGHHGSNTSTTEEFLKLVNPKIALIGVGKNNKYGHPSTEVINRLEENKTKIYRTDKDGEIVIIIKNENKIEIK